jgi:hypothetical protein
MRRQKKTPIDPPRMGRALDKTLRKLARTRRAAEALSALIEGFPALEEVELVEALSVKPDAVVFRALWRGDLVVIKRFISDKAPGIVTRMQDELATVAASLTNPRFQVNRCLLALPEAGLVVLDHVPGKRLRDHLATAGAAERARLLRLAADWLGAYCAPRRVRSGFGAKYWVRRAAAADITQLSAQDQALTTALSAAISERALAARGARLTRAEGHGDFVDINLIYDGTALYGVDIQGPARQPLARMAARFLVWLQLHSENSGARRVCGLDHCDLDAFLGGDLLDNDERHHLLPVFVGDQLLARFCNEYQGHKRRARAVAAIESYIAGT